MNGRSALVHARARELVIDLRRRRTPAMTQNRQPGFGMLIYSPGSDSMGEGHWFSSINYEGCIVRNPVAIASVVSE